MRPRSKPAARKPDDKTEMPPDILEIVRRSDEKGALELAGIAESGDRARAKAAKRGLFLLKRAGVDIPAAEPEPPKSPLAPSIADHAMMTNDGGTGSRLLWFVREGLHGGSPTVLTVLVNDQTGIVDLTHRKTPRRELDDRIADLKQREKTAIAEAPLDYARFLVQQAAQRNRDARTPLPQGYSEAVRIIGDPEKSYTESPVYKVIDAESVRSDGSISCAAEKLFELPWFEGWLLDFESVEPWEEKYFEAVSSRVLIDESQRARRGDAIVEEAADALISPETAGRYRRRLEDTALVLHNSGHEAEARLVLYHALTIDPEAKPSANPILRTLVHRSIYLVIAYKAQMEEEAERARQPGLIQRV